ncbi:MAG: PD-(D/E)XK nuclease family protein, partial [Campylobacteraceae bacterium]|nr:PD-(D/E)XK nuclease family protein [Campylobacteraceae bacterium]
MVYIFPTNRAVRAFYAQAPETNRLLPKAYSIQTFFEQALYVEGKVRADSLIRTLCMQEAISFDAFELLHIPKPFMAFVKHSSYLFRFFEELAGEELSFNALYGADTYAQYNEHLNILETVHSRYCKRLDELGYYDSITLSKDSVIDENFIYNSKALTIHHEGYFSGFEYRILSEIAKKIPIFVKMTAVSYNESEVQRIFGTKVDLDFEIEGEWLKKPNYLHQLPSKVEVVCSSFAQRSLQVGFIFDQIARFVEDGVNPEDIVVVLPDESFVDFLKIYDKNHLLNFAMGLSLKETVFYQKLKANQIYLNQPNEESRHRRARLGVIDGWSKAWSEKVDYLTFKGLLGPIDELNLEMKEIVETQMLRFERLFAWMNFIIFGEAISLFLQELSQERFDDVGGGAVTVMGVLETRGSSFKGVIIPDFNESMVPKRSEKDLFLSSSVRSYAKMPDSYDREQLQRYYYHKLLIQAKHKAISYVKNEESIPSRFLHAFETELWTYDSAKLASVFMPEGDSFTPFDEDPKFFHEVTKTPISASRLRVLLTCPRQYYYKYIEKIPY